MGLSQVSVHVNSSQLETFVPINQLSAREIISTQAKMGEPDIMTWFPRREDYEQPVFVQPDESYTDKIKRLIETIEAAQNSIKEVVDKDTLTKEHKIFRVMDAKQDLDELISLHKECESDGDASNHADDLKKAKVGIINLKAYMSQVSREEFAASIMNERLFKVGSVEGFEPWLKAAEDKINDRADKPVSFEACMEYEQMACRQLKETMKGNKMMKRLKDSAEGNKGNVEIQEELSRLSERYYVLCKKADARVKNMQSLLFEWKRLNEILAPKEPKNMDDLQVKQFVVFLRTYAAYFS